MTGDGRVRGLRQGGGGKANKMLKTSGAVPPLGTGARFKNVVSQLSKRPGTTNPAKLASFINQNKKRKKG